LMKSEDEIKAIMSQVYSGQAAPTNPEGQVPNGASPAPQLNQQGAY